MVSVLKIIECIHREIPGLQIQNEGESDLIITYEGEKNEMLSGRELKWL